ncbi:MAG: helix-turn-helix transcriptional regulator [Bdellovibrionaceae bacterium]|nr:helix-turn-helix transcriptional regulator [Pseudobdellovibrionaceae bacterium]
MSKKIPNDAIILRKLREIKNLDRPQAAVLMGTTHKNIEKMENGRTLMTQKRVANYLTAYGISAKEYALCLDGKIHLIAEKYATKRPKIIEHKTLRRSYQKIVTKEAKILKGMRKLRGYSQPKASAICGYARPSIGHIENGRIELHSERIKHIVQSYGFTMKDYEQHKRAEVLVTDTLTECISLVTQLSIENLNIAHSLLKTMKKNA